MPYYHDAPNKTVYKVPDAPMVFQEIKSTHSRNPERTGWRVTAEIEVTSAYYWKDGATGRWLHTEVRYENDAYDLRDSKDDAIRFFRNTHMRPPGIDVSLEEYEQLRDKYKKIAEDSGPPVKL